MATHTQAQNPALDGSPRTQEGLLSLVFGMNAFRVVATILVLVSHSAIPYAETLNRSALWLLHDSTSHFAIDYALFWVNGFAMPIFFLMAGVSAAQASATTPLGEFVWHRLRRLSSPFLLTMIFILPVAYLAWGFGFLLTERVSLSQLMRLRFAPELQSQLIGPFHLWFLEYLFLISVIWCALMKLTAWLARERKGASGWITRALSSPWRPVLFAIPTFGIFLLDVDTPYRLPNTFVPDIMRMAHYMLFFLAGTWIAKLQRPAEILKKHWFIYLASASILYLFLGVIGRRFLEGVLPSEQFPLLAFLQAMFAWLMVFGGLGFFLTYCSSRYNGFRFLNEASLWIYLVHLPLVAVAQLAVWPLNCHAVFKIVLVSSISLGLSLLSYQYCVRYSFLGVLTSGNRKRCAGVPAWRLEAGWVGTFAVGLALLVGFVYVNRPIFSGTNLHAVVPGKYYRSNRLSAADLVAAIKKHGLKSIISPAPAASTDPWWLEQQQICAAHGVQIQSLHLYDEFVPEAWQIEQLHAALDAAPRPVLLEGPIRTPTLSGVSSAIALLLDDVPPEEALQQLNWKTYSQLEGPEHCIVAKPLMAYRNWLTEHELPHSGETYRRWISTEKVALDQLAKEKQGEPKWMLFIGAPRYQRWR